MLKCLGCHGFLEFGKATGFKFSYNPLQWGVPIPWEIDVIVQRMKDRKEEDNRKKCREKKKKSNKKGQGTTVEYGRQHHGLRNPR
jgi:hypothetical protein